MKTYNLMNSKKTLRKDRDQNTIIGEFRARKVRNVKERPKGKRMKKDFRTTGTMLFHSVHWSLDWFTESIYLLIYCA